MGGFSGKYSRNPFATFEEEKNYAFPLMQEGIPVTDDDENAGRLQLLHQFRRGNQLFGNYGTPNDGFRVQEATSTANNFKLTGGGPSNTDIEAAGRFFMRGLQCVLMHDTDYYNTLSDVAEQSIHPRITRVYLNGGNTVVEDSAANWVATELVGRSVRIAGVDYAITSNGLDSFEISGDHTAAISNLDYYILLLSTPGGARADGVYLNVYVDEYDENDDSTIEKQIGGVAVVAQLRAKIIQTLFVRQNVTTHGELVDYVDSDGNQHYVFKLATIARTATANITTAMITDHVLTIGFTNIDQSQIGVLKVVPTLAGANNTVYVQEGSFTSIVGDSIITYAGGAYLSTFPTVTAANERWDLLTISDAGVITRIAGTESTPIGTAVKPDLPGTSTPLAYIYVDESTTVVIDEADIFDARPIISGNARGWKTLDPANGTVSAQLTALGVADGDRFWLLPGAYTLGANVDISADNVQICGPQSAVISVGTYAFTASGDGVCFKDITLTAAVTDNTNSFIIVTGADFHATDMLFTYSASGDKLYHIDLRSGAHRAQILRCRFNEGLGGTNPAHIHVPNAAGLSKVLIHQCLSVQSSASVAGFGVYVGTTAGFGVISECTFTLQCTAAIVQVGVFVGSTLWLIQGCKVDGSNGALTNSKGIQLGGDADDCRVIGNGVSGVETGLTMGGDSGVASGNTLRVVAGGDALLVTGADCLTTPNIEEVAGTAGASGVLPGVLTIGNTSLSLPIVTTPYQLTLAAPSMGAGVSFRGSHDVAGDVAEAMVHARLATTNATPGVLWTWSPPSAEEKTWLITAKVIARRTGGSGGSAQDSAGYVRVACFNNDGGTVALVGSAGNVFTAEDQAGWDCTIAVTGGAAVEVQVTGALNNNISWVGQIEIIAMV